ncbi:MAG: tetratricopeptide repeat protein [Chloroflexota bacterium]|nr:tetratricopeptide repeat protein [Chloroflexota bacterium]
MLTSLSYFPAFQAGFVWDDVVFTENGAVREWGDIWSLWLSPGHIEYEGHYWPLVYTTFWLEHKVWGFNAAGYHVVNVILHIANSLLVWRLFSRLSVRGAWLIAAVFAVHPLHVESVAWVIERKDLLSALFYLLAVLSWLKFQDSNRKKNYYLTLALFAAGLLSKSIVVTLPAALLVLAWWKKGRLERADLAGVAPLVIVGFFATLADFLFYSSRESVTVDLSLVERPLLAARAVVFYATRLAWPDSLAGIYPLWDIRATDPLAWGYLVVALAVPALLWRMRSRIGRGPLAGMLFFAVTLSPTLGLINYGYMQFSFVADRFQYLAGIGAIAVVVGGAATAWHKLAPSVRVAALAVPIAVLAVLAVLTWQFAALYRDDETFFRHVVEHNPTAHGAYDNLVKALNDQGRTEEFLDTARTALSYLPNDPTTNVNYALALGRNGHEQEAIAAYRRALELEPDNTRALVDLGTLLWTQDRYDEAMELFQLALAVDDGLSKPHVGMGLVEQARGNHADAERHYARALDVDPSDRNARHNLGVLNFEQKRYGEALASFRAALELESDDESRAESLSGAGSSLYQLGRVEEAIQSFNQALALDPSLPVARDYLRRIEADNLTAMFDAGRFQEVLDAARRSAEEDPGDAAAHVFAGAALAEMGDFDAAERYYRLALDIEPLQRDALVNLSALLIHGGSYDEAVDFLQTALDLYPTDAEVHRRMGQIEAARSNLDAAERHYRQAMALGLRDHEVLHSIGKLTLARGAHEEALEFLEAASERSDRDAVLQSNLGVALYHLGRRDEAIERFERALELDPSFQPARDNLERARQEAG